MDKTQDYKNMPELFIRDIDAYCSACSTDEITTLIKKIAAVETLADIEEIKQELAQIKPFKKKDEITFTQTDAATRVSRWIKTIQTADNHLYYRKLAVILAILEWATNTEKEYSTRKQFRCLPITSPCFGIEYKLKRLEQAIRHETGEEDAYPPRKLYFCYHDGSVEKVYANYENADAYLADEETYGRMPLRNVQMVEYDIVDNVIAVDGVPLYEWLEGVYSKDYEKAFAYPDYLSD